MSLEIAELTEQAVPFLTAAVGAYGAAVLARAEDAAADATATLGQRILRAVWRRRDEAGQTELERALAEAADEQNDSHAADVLSRFLIRALQEDFQLRVELSAMLPTPTVVAVNITANGERSMAAQYIGTAIIGDGHSAPRP
ncbi:hypothetical protein ACFWFU_05310 [Streptomyces sp. NPDC060235]|uniref:hypothetical protein n=1 Tax=Streptomyces sp. NPDC060235 TaxID=3347080 RepID=UPI003669A02E